MDRLDTGHLLWMALIFFVGGLIPALLVSLLMRKRKTPALAPHSRSEATTYTVMITTLVTVATFYVFDNPQMIGGAFLIAVVSQVQSLGLVYVIGLAFILVALFARLSGLAWVYYVLMGPATACLNATTLTQVGELGKQRVIDNVVGGILVIVATAVAIGYSQWATRHGESTNADHEVEAGTLSPAGAGSSGR